MANKLFYNCLAETKLDSTENCSHSCSISTEAGKHRAPQYAAMQTDGWPLVSSSTMHSCYW